jgi:four helix bundle protein
MTGSYKDLRVWQDAMGLAVQICALTGRFPRHELYGLANQLRRAAVSVPSNIAEGKGHRSDLEFSHFLYHARGSLLEVETQILISSQLKYLSEQEADHLLNKAGAVARSLNALINALGTKDRSRRLGKQLTTND